MNCSNIVSRCPARFLGVDLLIPLPRPRRIARLSQGTRRNRQQFVHVRLAQSRSRIREPATRPRRLGRESGSLPSHRETHQDPRGVCRVDRRGGGKVALRLTHTKQRERRSLDRREESSATPQIAPTTQCGPSRPHRSFAVSATRRSPYPSRLDACPLNPEPRTPRPLATVSLGGPIKCVVLPLVSPPPRALDARCASTD